jgi:thioredoxin-dependent peroxiredoxin
VGYNFGVGREAPTFTMNAADGSEINLKQYRGDWFPVLLFVPTQTPGIEKQLAQLSAAADDVWGLRGQLLGLCDASRDDVKALADRVEGLSFPLLPDDGRVAKAYGALAKSGEVRPMAFIVDRAGKVVWTGDGIAALRPATLISAFRQVAR